MILGRGREGFERPLAFATLLLDGAQRQRPVEWRCPVHCLSHPDRPAKHDLRFIATAGLIAQGAEQPERIGIIGVCGKKLATDCLGFGPMTRRSEVAGPFE